MILWVEQLLLATVEDEPVASPVDLKEQEFGVVLAVVTEGPPVTPPQARSERDLGGPAFLVVAAG